MMKRQSMRLVGIYAVAAALSVYACASSPERHGATALSIAADAGAPVGAPPGAVDIVVTYDVESTVALADAGPQGWFDSGRTLPTASVRSPDAYSFEIVAGEATSQRLVYRSRPEAVFAFARASDGKGGETYRVWSWAKDPDRFRAPGLVEGWFSEPPKSIDVRFKSDGITVEAR